MSDFSNRTMEHRYDRFWTAVQSSVLAQDIGDGWVSLARRIERHFAGVIPARAPRGLVRETVRSLSHEHSEAIGCAPQHSANWHGLVQPRL
jgi:hypothetical protein